MTDTTFDSTVMAGIFLAMEQGKMQRGGTNEKQDFKQFLKEYVSSTDPQDEEGEPENDQQEQDEDENPETLNTDIRNRIRTYFDQEIREEKKLKCPQIKTFLAELAEAYPKKKLNWKVIKNFAWGIVVNKKNREKKESKGKSKKSQKKSTEED